MEQQRAHIWYFDTLRAISALGVVYMHTAAAGLRAGVAADPGGVTRGWHLLNLLTSLAFTAVPLFFMISGYLLFSDPKTERVEVLLRRRLPRLAVPLAAWTAVTALYQALHGAGNPAVNFLVQLRGALYSPILTPLWFMYSLVAFYLLSPFLYAGLHHLTRDGHALVLGILAAVSLKAMVRALLPPGMEHYADVNIFAQVTALGGYLLQMLLGWYLGNWKRRLPGFPLALTTAGLYILVVLGTWARTAAKGEYDRAFQNQSAGFELLLACCLFLLAKQYLDRPSRLWAAVPFVTLSLPVYLMHGLALRVLETNHIIPLRFPAVVRETVLVTLVCFLVSKTLASIPPLCYLFTGLRYEEARQSCTWGWTLKRLRGIRA